MRLWLYPAAGGESLGDGEWSFLPGVGWEIAIGDRTWRAVRIQKYGNGTAAAWLEPVNEGKRAARQKKRRDEKAKREEVEKALAASQHEVERLREELSLARRELIRRTVDGNNENRGKQG